MLLISTEYLLSVLSWRRWGIPTDASAAMAAHRRLYFAMCIIEETVERKRTFKKNNILT